MSSHQSYDPERSPLSGTMLLEASAGTGKTYALERMVARLVARDENPLGIREILVVTFTNKAAGEMKERIRTLLSERARDSSRRNSERQRCSEALTEFDQAAIYTIHGFCQMVLSTWPFESSSPFNQALEPGGKVEREAAHRWIASRTDDDVDGDLLRAAYNEAHSADALVGRIAGELSRQGVPPGARVLPSTEESAAFARFIEVSKNPDSPLNAAVTAIASREWSPDAFKLLSKAVRGDGRGGKRADSLEKLRLHLKACREARGIVAVSHAFFGDPAGVGIGKHFRDVLGWAGIVADGEAADPDILKPGSDAAELAEAMAALLHEMGPYVETSGSLSNPPTSLVDRYLRCAFMDEARTGAEELAEAIKESEGRWGYDDLISKVAEAVEDDNSPLKPLLRRKFKAALIDEFQDTDPRQWQLFNILFGDRDHLLALIGDPKQSIYGFRGTDLQAYAAAKKTVGSESLYRLDTNYRSLPALVKGVNAFFEPIFTQAYGENDPVGFSQVKPGKEPYPALDYFRAPTPMVALAVNGEGRKLQHRAVEAIVSEIRQLLDPAAGGHLVFENGESRPVSPGDIAVLSRGRAGEDDVLAGLASMGIPAIRFGSRSVFRQPAAAQMRGLLEALDKPRSMSRWRGLLLGDLAGLTPRLLHDFENAGVLDGFVEKGEQWREAFLQGHSSEALDDFFRFTPRLADRAETLGHSQARAALKEPWNRRILRDPDGERHWQDWRHLADLIRIKQAEGLREPGDILAWLDESFENEGLDGSDDSVRLATEAPAVRVMTMHASKGLEFPLVFILGGLNGASSRDSAKPYRFDSSGVLTIDRLTRESNRLAHLAYEWEETKRLWYVAFTRASVGLWFCTPTEGGICAIESLLGEACGIVGEHLSKNLPPHEAGGKDDEFRESLNEALIRYGAEKGKTLSVKTALDVVVLPLQPPIPPAPIPAPLPAAPPANRDPATLSYTALVKAALSSHGADGLSGSLEKSGDYDDRDVDGLTVIHTEPVSSIAAEEPIPLENDRGALFGTLVHALYENCEFAKAADDEKAWFTDSDMDETFSSLAGRYYPPDWYRSRGRALKALVRRTLRSPIPGLGRLCDLPENSSRAEVEFLMALPRASRPAIKAGKVTMEKGFLKGFIDLLVRAEGRWWVVDWKTNVPHGAESAEAFDAAALEAMMDSHEYHLQYELYLLALCASLASSRSKPVDWDNEVGGAAYLFVRGMRDTDHRGVYTAKPEKHRMLTLAEEAGLTEVLR